MSPTKKKKTKTARKSPARKAPARKVAKKTGKKTGKKVANKTAKKRPAKSAGKKKPSAGKPAARQSMTRKKTAAGSRAAAKGQVEKVPAKKSGAKKSEARKTEKTGTRKAAAAKAGKSKSRKSEEAAKPAPKGKPVPLSDIPHPQYGLKFECFGCSTKFYEMGRPDPICPKCGTDQRERPKAEPKTTPKAKRSGIRPMAPLLDDDEEVATPDDATPKTPVDDMFDDAETIVESDEEDKEKKAPEE